PADSLRSKSWLGPERRRDCTAPREEKTQRAISQRAMARTRMAKANPQAPQTGPSHAAVMTFARIRRTVIPDTTSPIAAAVKTGSLKARSSGRTGAGGGRWRSYVQKFANAIIIPRYPV